MKIMKLESGKWAWSIRATGMVGQAYGEAWDKFGAVMKAISRLRELRQ